MTESHDEKLAQEWYDRKTAMMVDVTPSTSRGFRQTDPKQGVERGAKDRVVSEVNIKIGDWGTAVVCSAEKLMRVPSKRIAYRTVTNA